RAGRGAENVAGNGDAGRGPLRAPGPRRSVPRLAGGEPALAGVTSQADNGTKIPARAPGTTGVSPAIKKKWAEGPASLKGGRPMAGGRALATCWRRARRVK